MTDVRCAEHSPILCLLRRGQVRRHAHRCPLRKSWSSRARCAPAPTMSRLAALATKELRWRTPTSPASRSPTIRCRSTTPTSPPSRGRRSMRSSSSSSSGGASRHLHRQPRIQRLDHAAAEERHRLDLGRCASPASRSSRCSRTAPSRSAPPRPAAPAAAVAAHAAPGAGDRLPRVRRAGAGHGAERRAGVRRDGRAQGRPRRRPAQDRGAQADRLRAHDWADEGR